MTSGAYIFGCAGTALSANEAQFFRDAAPWGFILFARNIDTPDQLRRLTADLREAVGWHAPILIDQEGGRVQRMGPPFWRQYLPALDQVAATGAQAERAMYIRNRLIAEELFSVGIDVNCAPVADVVQPQTHPIMRNRCYGGDVETVVTLSRACAEGFLDGGVLPVLKHIPGYGRAVVDGHKDLPRVDVPRDQLDAIDFAPFKALSDLPMGMTAHIVLPCIDDLAATVSPAVMRVIREDIGFDNLIMTDDVSMEALSGTVADRSRAALDAGCDLALHCNGDLAEMRTIADICGPQTAQVKARADRALACRRLPIEVDIPAIEAELSDLISG